MVKENPSLCSKFEVGEENKIICESFDAVNCMHIVSLSSF